MVDNIPELVGYHISREGVLFSRYDKSGHLTPRWNKTHRMWVRESWHEIKPNKNKEGYLFIQRHISGVNKIFYLHRLVAQAYVSNPDPEKKIQVCHRDAIVYHNSTHNLYWGTPKENMEQVIRDGHISAKYTKRMAELIKEDYDSGIPMWKLCILYSIGRTTLRKIVKPTKKRYRRLDKLGSRQ